MIIENHRELNLTLLRNLCREHGGCFTLGDLVTRVLHERPRMIGELADAWGEMHRRHMVRVARPGRPAVYEVWENVGDHSDE
jgi:hypothetical protein